MTDRRESDQMRANLEAVLFDHYGLPVLQRAAQFPGRCFWYPTPEFFAALDALVVSGQFRRWGGYGNHGPAAVASWRENVPRYSVQLVQHGTPESGDVMLEGDIDRFNPDYGAGVAVVHFFVDVLGPKAKASSLRIGLIRRGIPVPMA